MKVILCTGSPHSGHEQVFDLLVQAGVATAKPTSKDVLTPQTLQAQLLRSLEFDLSGAGPLNQVVPGKLWEQLAADLLLANINSSVWGWADHQTAVLMDFWQNFDPQVRLLLAYTAPQDYLAQTLDLTRLPTPQAVTLALDQWTRWNTALLRYYYRHPECCVLISSQQAMEQPQAMLSALASQWQLSELGTSAVSHAPAHGHLQLYLINQLIDPQHPALGLSQELDCAALLPRVASANPQGEATPIAAWSDWVGMRAERMQTAQVAAQLADHQRESELLLLQLHQVQEELEHYFLLYQELQQQQQSNANGFVSDFWRMHQPAEVCVDMRRGVVGSNWYYAEADGCWAGPALVSSVQMPPLQPGIYTLALDVVDAMHRDIVQNMLLEALGQSVHFEIEPLTAEADYPLVCKAQLCIAPDTQPAPWHINLRFTHLVSPAESGADDNRHLAVRLQTLRLRKNL